MKDIVRDGDPVLRAEAQEVTFPLSDDLIKLSDKMMEFLINSQDEEIAKKHQLRAGVGLAAPQVGVSKKFTAVLIPGPDGEIIFKEVLFNPVITRSSVKKVALAEGEGCLSVDIDYPGYVPRDQKITVRYQDITGATKEIKLKDYEAIVLQHEIDHLHGRLFYDRINKEKPFFVEDNMSLIQ